MRLNTLPHPFASFSMGLLHGPGSFVASAPTVLYDSKGDRLVVRTNQCQRLVDKNVGIAAESCTARYAMKEIFNRDPDGLFASCELNKVSRGIGQTIR